MKKVTFEQFLAEERRALGEDTIVLSGLIAAKSRAKVRMQRLGDLIKHATQFIRAVEAMWADPEVTALVKFENHDFWSSQLGASTVMRIGPHCSFHAPEELEGRHLNDLPSQRQYATVYCTKEDQP